MHDQIRQGSGTTRKSRMARYAPVVVVVLLGTATSVGLFYKVQGWERRAALREFQREAGERVRVLKDNLNGELHAVQSVGYFYAASNRVEPG